MAILILFIGIGIAGAYLALKYIENEKTSINNTKNIDDRINEIKSETDFSNEIGEVISSETIAITNTSGKFHGGGGNISTSSQGYTSGTIGSINGSISSSTRLISKFFVKTENAEYSVEIDADDLQVRNGSKVKLHWISWQKHSRIFKISNLDTKQDTILKGTLNEMYRGIIEAKTSQGGAYYGIEKKSLLAKTVARVVAEE
ncbi:hypothetical protein BWR17_09750 [Phaeobacter inhibens]|nr:hypothetical protein BWR17_09750 [Phaeobacter inhibens]